MSKSKIPKSNLEIRTLEEGIDEHLREVYGNSIEKLTKIVEVGLAARNKSIVADKLFRFLYGLKFKGYQQIVFLLLDIMDMRTYGLQAGVILESTVHRGALILPERIYPLELAKEEKRNHHNPFYSLLMREKENFKDSGFFKSFDLNVQMHEEKVPSLVESPTGGIVWEKYKVEYPRYLVIYPNENKTIITFSISTPSHKRLEKYYRDKNGKFHLLKYLLPKENLLQNLLPMMIEAEKRVMSIQCDYSIKSKKLELLPLFEFLVNIASNEDLISNRDFIKEVFELTLYTRGLKKLGPLNYEITTMQSILELYTSRYRPTAAQCPKCKATYNYSYDMISAEGMVKCSNCLHVFQGIDMGPNY
jgi:predicted Zn finger-like uncharacterized protein